MSSNKPPPTASNQPNRLPAPSLFIGPPSRNASNTSLLSPVVTSGTVNHIPQGSPPGNGVASAAAAAQPRQQARRPRGGAGRADARADALWAEMQSTLEEVELSAGPGARVFGAGHGAALEALRGAQMALARAWARGEGDGEGEGGADADAEGDGEDGLFGGAREGAAEMGGGARAGRGALEEETERDVVLARRRRAANDRYFERVNAGVADVVARLEDVARAMKGVERESKEIWGEAESIETGASAA
ncbi:hypothetical protein BDY21DRAFT_314377 [Lineolata rhizophorae]|uniref:Uncharacterized protein n=1 Tax=Lineolata rhizophorae TaxID=578093 RepID=A0A6A6PCU0_9PEZI|nr:hypothetical protein BDY21DRAFT_314377 [Lineolata rhizophorae]